MMGMMKKEEEEHENDNDNYVDHHDTDMELLHFKENTNSV